ncbi:MAG: fibrinogen-like YCDxxxxGGGW domain-containing protein, partial [Nanoarchaeota archaeon]
VVNVSVNDTFNNINSTLYQVTVQESIVPNINFTYPTPDNNTILFTNDTIKINVTSSENLTTCNLNMNWNDPVSCLQILDRYPSSSSGIYTIDPDGEGGNSAFQVYCDMVTEGGGWIIIAKVSHLNSSFSLGSHNSGVLGGTNWNTDIDGLITYNQVMLSWNSSHYNRTLDSGHNHTSSGSEISTGGSPVEYWEYIQKDHHGSINHVCLGPLSDSYGGENGGDICTRVYTNGEDNGLYGYGLGTAMNVNWNYDDHAMLTWNNSVMYYGDNISIVEPLYIGVKNLTTFTLSSNYSMEIHNDDSNTWANYTLSNLSNGSYSFYVNCTDGASNSNSTETRTINTTEYIPSSRIMLDIFHPSGDINVSKNRWFNVSVNVTCAESDCGLINVSLDPSTCPIGTQLFSTSNGSTYDICAETTKRSDDTWSNARAICQANYAGGDICPQSFYQDMLNTAWCTSYMTFGGSNNEEWRNDTTEGRVDGISTCTSSVSYNTDSGSNEYRCCVLAEPVKGLVSTTPSLTSFYTNISNNPYTVNLSLGESEVVNFWVNATKTINSVTEFFFYANLSDYPTVKNITDTWNVTILGYSPALTLNSPVAETATGTTVNFNWSVDHYESVTCNITVNDSVVASYITSNIGYTSSEVGGLAEGDHNWSITCNDSYGYKGTSDAKNFTFVITYPQITQNRPTNGEIVATSTVTFNWSINHSQTVYCNLSVDNSLVASNISSYTSNYTTYGHYGLSVGDHNWSLVCIDHYGYKNVSNALNFTLDLPLSVSLYSPATHTNMTQGRFNRFSVNITCGNYDCDEINVSLDPLSTCNASAGTAAACAGCGDLFLPSTSGWTYLTANGGMCWVGGLTYLTGLDGICDTVGASGTIASECALYSETGSSFYVCPSYDRMGRAVISNDCNCYNAPCSFSRTYAQAFDFTSEYFAGPTVSTKGLVNTTEGATPFWMNGTNPQTINLTANSSEVVTFYVVPTGNYNSIHEFYAYANTTADLEVGSQTSTINITISRDPFLNITLYSPTSDTNFTQNEFTQFTVNVTCGDYNCSNVSVYLDPIKNCDITTNNCSNTCDLLYTNSTSGWMYLADIGGGVPACYGASAGSTVYLTLTNTTCDSVTQITNNYNSDCNTYSDDGNTNLYVCPSYKRKGIAVTSDDCACVAGDLSDGNCSNFTLTIANTFDFTSEYFAGACNVSAYNNYSCQACGELFTDGFEDWNYNTDLGLPVCMNTGGTTTSNISGTANISFCDTYSIAGHYSGECAIVFEYNGSNIEAVCPSYARMGSPVVRSDCTCVFDLAGPPFVACTDALYARFNFSDNYFAGSGLCNVSGSSNYSCQGCGDLFTDGFRNWSYEPSFGGGGEVCKNTEGSLTSNISGVSNNTLCDAYSVAGSNYGECAFVFEYYNITNYIETLCPSYARLGSAVSQSDCLCADTIAPSTFLPCTDALYARINFSDVYFAGETAAPVSGKGGLISTVAGTTPFYTNASSNPLYIDLSANSSQLVTFWVNATGNASNSYEFYAYAKVVSNTSISPETVRINITIDNVTEPVQVDPLVINSVNATPEKGAAGSVFNITVNVSSGYTIDTVIAYIQRPDENNTANVTLSLYNGFYNGSWNSTGYADGAYVVDIFANDTSTNTEKENADVVVVASYAQGKFTNSTVDMQNAMTYLINASNRVNTTLYLTGVGNLNTSVNIVQYSQKISGLECAAHTNDLARYFEIIVNNNTNTNLTSSKVQIHYDDDYVTASGIQESSLRLYKCNKSTGNWILLDGAVDINSNYVYGNVSSFSVFGVFGSAATTAAATVTPTTTTTGGGGKCIPKWNCTEWSECMPDGKQARTCTIVGTCRLDYNKPDESRECEYKSKVEEKEEIVEEKKEEIEQKAPERNNYLVYMAIILGLLLILSSLLYNKDKRKKIIRRILGKSQDKSIGKGSDKISSLQIKKDINHHLYKSKQKSVKEELAGIISKYENKIISHKECTKLLSEKIDGKTREEWFDHYSIQAEKNKPDYEKKISDDVISKIDGLGFDLKYSPKLTSVKQAAPYVLLLLVFLSFSFFGLEMTGYTTITKEIRFTDSLDIYTNNSLEYLWLIDNPSDLTSIKLSGSVSLQGKARVYIENNDRNYLIFDSDKLKEIKGISSISTITGSVIENISNELDIDLEYASDSAYDENDDGVESVDGIIDFTVSNSEINLDKEKLCTKWIINDDQICYGKKECCNFINLESSKDNWDDIFYLNYGLYGAGYENIVSAQIIYADYNLSIENAYSDVRYSDIVTKQAMFYPDMISFENFCLET